ncbi:uncharacterized protein LACBIDRAFT_299595 [Laccaria bicolor S238N-H82]|uniref:non-specific serine/threonine protein kinase n=1 Tax=Laccaria bicolor (strain S238N-H82 / ATCC MYA-4686) TaxID=486041 RepID=B0DEX8_LACBS|nr:uncharacterized protein LACBIDRAFT_299595 [Laccaria bicolor S238N-H82]EDR06625.1 predicted protein [Laccaria bicolor S238N-H82]|eukprot:XP_001882472.1 predicted protein [Laccaria bicolor S238N-H82]
MSLSSSPFSSAVALVPVSDPEWQPILHASNQVVLYNPTSHALTISHSTNVTTGFPSTSTAPVKASRDCCPYCKRVLPSAFDYDPFDDSGDRIHSHDEDEEEEGIESLSSDPAYTSRVSDYFQLLEIANESSSRPSSPPGPTLLGASASSSTNNARQQQSGTSAFPAEKMAEGYFKTFFQEEYRLGMGANGSVYLCQHMLDGNPLGHFAVKKIAVGESHSYLLKILREVRLLERLHHPNIVTYHHAWLETAQFSSFGPKVPTLHVLMQWAEGGSLDDFIDIRLGRKPSHIHFHAPGSTDADYELGTPAPPPLRRSGTPAHTLSASDLHSRSARIRAFRAFQRAGGAEGERQRERETRKRNGEWTAVHLLSADEVKGLFKDVVAGLGFLHDKSILHLDLKPGNVLLTWDEGKLIPRAMLSDFGTSRDMINSTRLQRSGNTGTLEYTSPESLPSPHTGLLQQIDSKSDMWSLGMILHKLLFFKLPYRYAAEGDANGEAVTGGSRAGEGEKMDKLEREVLEYPGFKTAPGLVAAFEARRLPRSFLVLLESLLNKIPAARPSCERVAGAIREGKLDPLREIPQHHNGAPSSLVRVRSRSRSGSADKVVNVDEAASAATERARLLGLPSPTEVLGPEEGVWGGWWRKARVVARRNLGITRRGRRGKVYLRVVRSVVLVAKVLSIPHICSSYPVGEMRPRMGVVALLLGAAVADTVVEYEPWHRGVAISLGLALAHVCVVVLGKGARWCCTV